MLKIYLVRHGQDQDNANKILNGRRDTPLTKKGLEQAQELAEKIKETGISFSALYSSPLKRAYKTASTITNALGLKNPIELQDLIERDFGVMTGKPVDSIKKLCSPDIIQADVICYFLSPQFSETFPQLIVRATKLLGELKNNHQDGNVLMVTHGDIGKMIYAAYYNLGWKEVLTMFHFGNCDLLELSKESSPENAHVFKTKQHNA